MNRRRRRFLAWGLLAALMTLAGGCHREPAGWSPVLTEHSSIPILQERLEDARDEIEQARQEPSPSPEALERAQRHLQVLLEYHLPLLEARERATRAYRLHLLGRSRQTHEELDGVRSLLEGIATEHPRVAPELEQPLETLLHLRNSMDAGKIAEAEFDRLITEIHSLELKARLALQGTPLALP